MKIYHRTRGKQSILTTRIQNSFGQDITIIADVCARNASEATGIYKQCFRTIYKTTKQDYKNSEKRNNLDIPVKTN